VAEEGFFPDKMRTTACGITQIRKDIGTLRNEVEGTSVRGVGQMDTKVTIELTLQYNFPGTNI